MSRFTGGWIKLYRAMLEIEGFESDLELCGLWVNLLLMANYKESNIDWGGQIRVLEPGQILLTQRELVGRWGVPKTTLFRRFRNLQKWDRIRTESGPHGTIITICNWNEYQNIEELSGPRMDQERTKSGPRVDLYKEVKKERSKEGKKSNVGIRLDYPPEFNELWETYGRRGDKKAAYVEFKRLMLSEDEFSKLNVAVKNYCTNKEIQYRLHLVRFLKTDWRENIILAPNGHAKSDLFDFLPHRAHK